MSKRRQPAASLVGRPGSWYKALYNSSRGHMRNGSGWFGFAGLDGTLTVGSAMTGFHGFLASG